MSARQLPHRQPLNSGIAADLRGTSILHLIPASSPNLPDETTIKWDPIKIAGWKAILNTLAMTYGDRLRLN
jgi:hypothetical protein